jgi:hypothetical protein
MKSEGWFVPDAKGYNHYEDGNPDGSDTVTMPDANGNGGGNWQSNKLREWLWNWNEDPKYHDAFDKIRQRVDKALEPWEDLPDPTAFDEYIEHLRGANSKLAVSFSASDGVAVGAGPIGDYLKTIDQNASSMSGGMINTFKKKFLNALGRAIGGHHGLTVILGQALTGEQNLIKQARADVTTAVTTYTKALEAYAHDTSSNAAFAFKVIGAVVAGASAFATGGATAAFGGAAAALTLLTTLAEEDEKAAKEAKEAKEPEAKDYQGLMKGFETALNDLNTAIKAREGTIATSLSKNRESVYNYRDSFNLTNPIENIDDDSDLHEGDGRAIIHNHSLAREITHHAMPGIADELKKAAEAVWDGWNGSPYYRDPTIGRGETGPYPEWSELADPTWRLIGDLEWEVRNGAKTLELAIEDMGRTDTDSQDALEKHAASIAGYQNYEVPKPE